MKRPFWNRALNHQNKKSKLSFRRIPKKLDELVPVFISEERIMDIDFGNPRKSPEDQILDAQMRGRRDGDRVCIAAQSSLDPEYVNF
jgi:hypothetical protein